MWRADSSRSDFRKILTVGEIIAISVIVVSFAAFIWINAGIGSIDPFLQVMFVGAFFLGIIFATNFVLDRRW